MLALIADGGATKVDWCLVQDGAQLHRIVTPGMNPFQVSDELIRKMLQEDLLPQLPPEALQAQIFFYGAGCTPEKCISMGEMLREAFPQAETIQVMSDLWGTARALCGHEEGIACILGTGCNSCYYDGQSIVKNIPPLGFILGDEGSGNALGRLLLNRILKEHLPEHIRQLFFEEMGLTYAEILDRVYRQPMAGRFLASLVPFVGRHKDEPALKELLIQNFRHFFQSNIMPYGRKDLPINFIGGLANAYAAELREAAAIEGYHVGRIAQSPIPGLQEYHRK